MNDLDLQQLPPHLRERSRALSSQLNRDGELVLYWMRTAVRSDENPALDVAATLANQLNVPLLVYHGLSEHYRYASDRHHTFMMQGAADVERQFTAQGVSYAFHLATPVDRSPHLIELANRAVAVVTEDMPVDPPRKFLEALNRQTATPIVCVDTACVAPMQSTNQAFTRAFQFREATDELYADRIDQPWPERLENVAPYDLSRLPFEPIDFEQHSISELVAKCEIDHSVGPVVDTIGGSEAGYKRWEHFKQSGLRGYASKRNNALIDGVSRMSAYLHYGMVSPMRLAREASAVGGKGGEKYLDELLIWRELAYHFCFHRKDHDQWSAIPKWAQDTLNKHRTDVRPKIYSWEQLARGKTDSHFWNAAQHSLLMQGELHNNVRMTWGKAILDWTAEPETALDMMIDLNHRYALDGRDPASYGGLLWCLGQFDRPFKPEQPILGTVRSRPTDHHAARLDPTAYAAKVATPRFSPVPKIAIIGAGMSGTIAARTLSDHGLEVTIFEKSRNCGGRMSTRRRDGEPSFDHGAQYFTARDERFARYVQSWQQQGVVAKWPSGSNSIVVMKNGAYEQKETSVDRYVGVPGMRSVVEHLAEDLSIRFKTTITKIDRDANEHWQLSDSNNQVHGPFDRLIIAVPSPQATALLKTCESTTSTHTEMLASMLPSIEAISMNPSWATMVQLDAPLDCQRPWSGAFVHDSSISWVARDGLKPQRNPGAGEHLVLHATADWTIENLDRAPEEIASEMMAEFWRVSGWRAQPTVHLRAHRWRYAIPIEPAPERTLFSKDLSIACCGDWLGGPRIEGAFLSGMATAGRILGTLSASGSDQRKQQPLFV